MSPVSTSIRYRRSEQVDETRVGDRLVLYHRDSGNGVVLNPSGSVVWDELRSAKTIDDLIDTLSARYPAIARQRVSSDVLGYVDSLCQQNLLTTDE